MTPLRYIGPFSPFGSLTGGLLFGACLVLVAVVAAPPVGYLIRHVVRPEFVGVSHAIWRWQVAWSA